MSSWLSTTLQSVRDKSLDALDFVRKDLTEFTTTVKTDTETYLHKIKTAEVPDLSLEGLLPKWNNSTKSNQNNESNLHTTASFDRFQTELKRIQNDESTYLIDPNPFDAYENWRQTNDFNVETRKGEISQLLIDAPHVRAFYARIVPAETSHAEFWARYYYRIHQLEEEEARRTQLIRRAHEICTEQNDEKDLNDGTDWDEPDEQWSESLPSHPAVAEISKEEDKAVVNVVEELVMKESDTDEKLMEESPTINKHDNIRLASGDSWEHEFEEHEVSSSSSKLVPTTESDHVSPTKEKKSSNEFDDEWEAWS